MKKIFIGVMTLALLASQAKADEGMWLPWLLKHQTYEAMKKRGLKLTREQLYDVNKSSLKDAIVWFGAGCTGEIISPNGLVLTNHHCGYDAISDLSSPGDNILDNGFWAKSYAEERPVPGLSVTFVVRVDDITDEVLAAVKGLNEKERTKKLSETYKTIVERTVKGTHYEAQCREMFKGNAYYVFTFERFTDIRLVGAPPQNIGKFGGETDNWMWPRHTGDFSMFRVYSSKEGKPARYSADNVPLKAKHHLPINLKGINSGDYAMIMGFPGRTNRYEFSQGVKMATDQVDPAIVALRDVRLNAWREVMAKDTDIRLKLSGDFARVSNYWKYFRGEAEQLKNNKVYEQKLKEEQAFAKWAAGKPEYQNLLADVEKAYAAYRPYALQRIYLSEGIMTPTVIRFASLAAGLEEAVSQNDTARLNAQRKSVIAAMEDLPYEPMIVEADKRSFDSLLVLYYNNIPAGQQAPYFRDVILKYDANPREAIRLYTNDVFENSIFTSKGMAIGFAQYPRISVLKKDPAYRHYEAFRTHYLNEFRSKTDEFSEVTAALGRTYVKGLMEMNPKKDFYSDANSSLRLTYGSVKSYMKYPLITNLDEVIAKNEKYGTDNPEFAIPDRLRELHRNKDYGRYATKDGKLPVAFLSDNDITGGNSGSPVIDAEGRIIGLAFDGNWEAMSGNIHFDPRNKRTISVDIRYVLFLIDKFGQAPNIISEMTIVQ